MLKTHYFRLIIALMLVLTSGGSLLATYDTAFGQDSPEEVKYIVARVYYHDREELDLLASQLDVWEVNHTEGYLVALLSQAQVDQLGKSGFRLEIDQARSEQVNQPLVPLLGQGTDSIPGYPCYRTLEETYADMASLELAYPSLVDLVDIGDSWDKLTEGGEEGYDILMLHLTNEQRSEKYARFFLMAEVHAREYVTSETALRLAEHLVSNYGVDPDITWMLDYFEIYILPMSNPDGRIFAEDGVWWRKNTDYDDKDPACLYPTYGVDLNRNNGFHWDEGGSSDDPCDETYHGPSPDSEPETQIIQNQLLTLFPDQRGEDDQDAAPDDTTGLFISLHSYSELVIWPWGWTNTDAPNHEQLQTLGRKMAYFNHYLPEQAYNLYETTGSNEDWTYGTLGIASYTYEMGTDFFQDCDTFEITIYPDNLQALMNSFKAARRPYQNPAGPESLYVTLPDGPVLPGTPVQLTARANDTRYNNENGNEPTQNIIEARYSIDNPSWVSGTATYPMAASDGSFDSNIEYVQATIDTTGISNGRHLIFVESQDADGNWGYTSGVFLDIIDPAIAPHITGYVRDVVSKDPIEATISAGKFQTTSSPETGYYDLLVYSGTYTVTANASYYVPMAVSDITVEDGQTIQQDFELEAMCEIFFDDVEHGNLGWTTDSPWAITDEDSHSATHSWTDSPDGYYANNQNISMTSENLNLQNWDQISLLFWHNYDIQTRYDFGIVEYSMDNGTTWLEAARYNGDIDQWVLANLYLPELAGSENAKIRFRLSTNNLIFRDGWHIDDIQLVGSGLGCLPPPPGYKTFLPLTSKMGLDSPTSFYEPSIPADPSKNITGFPEIMIFSLLFSLPVIKKIR